MGQTQLLLVVLGMLLVGIAVFVGISIFSANTVESTRNAIIVDLGNFASRATQYYWRPVTQGGGGKSFASISISQIYPMEENENARYYIESAEETECVIVGVGKIVTSNDDSIRVRIRVTTQRNIIEILN